MTTIDSTKTVTMYLVQNGTNTITKQCAWPAWYCLIQIIPLLKCLALYDTGKEKD